MTEDKQIAELKLIDNDLELKYCGKFPAGEPDNSINAYRFIMLNANSKNDMGCINIKAGFSENIIYNRGNIGFTVYEDFRGNHYSSRSCILLIPVLKILKMDSIWLTCDIDNWASRKNIEAIGAQFFGIVTISEGSPYFVFYPEGSRIKCRFRWEIK